MTTLRTPNEHEMTTCPHYSLGNGGISAKPSRWRRSNSLPTLTTVAKQRPHVSGMGRISRKHPQPPVHWREKTSFTSMNFSTEWRWALVERLKLDESRDLVQSNRRTAGWTKLWAHRYVLEQNSRQFYQVLVRWWSYDEVTEHVGKRYWNFHGENKSWSVWQSQYLIKLFRWSVVAFIVKASLRTGSFSR